jgi:hypothetical protein
MADLRLASIDGERTITIGLSDVAIAARGFADALDAGKASARTAILLTVNDEGTLETTWLGQGPTIAEALGLLELAKAKIVQGAWRA